MNLPTAFPLSIFFLAIIFANVKSLTFEKESQSSGLIFVKLSQARVSYDSYNTVYHIELEEYFKIRSNIDKHVETLIGLCSKINETGCINTSHELKIQLQFMLRDELDIQTYQQKSTQKARRNKRSWNWPGSVLHWAFGLMDADTAESYDHKINEIVDQTNRIHNDLQDQTIFIKESIELNSKAQLELQAQIQSIIKKIDSYKMVKAQIERLIAEQAIQETISILMLQILEHQRLSNQILNGLRNAISGQSLQLIPIRTLINDLLISTKILPISQMYPIDFETENSLHIFEHAKTSVSLFGTRLLIQIIIPIVERQSYTVYEIIPVPMRVDNKTVVIEPTTTLVLLNNNGVEFIPLLPSEYENAKTNFKNEKIIKPSKNSQLDYTQSCEITIFMNPRRDIIHDLCNIRIIPNANYFISLNHNNLFFVTIVNPTTITEHCDESAIRTHDLTENGKLTINCRITTHQISIRPKLTMKFESTELIVLSNRTNELTMSTLSDKIQYAHNVTFEKTQEDILVKDYTVEYSKLIEKADKYIEKQNTYRKIEKIHYDQVNTSYFIYWIIGIAIVFIILGVLALVAYLYMKFHNINTWENLATKLSNRGVDHRMPTLFLRNRPAPTAPIFNTYSEMP